MTGIVICHFKSQIGKVILVARIRKENQLVLSVGEYGWTNQSEWDAAFAKAQEGDGTLKIFRTKEGFQLIGELGGQTFDELFNLRGAGNNTITIEPIVKKGQLRTFLLEAL